MSQMVRMHLLLLHIQTEPPRTLPHPDVLVLGPLQTLLPHPKLGGNLLHQLVVHARVHSLATLLAQPRLRVLEELQMLADRVRRMRLVHVRVVEELVERGLVQRHCRRVVARRRVQA